MIATTPTPAATWPENIIREEMRSRAKEAARAFAEALNSINDTAAVYGLKIRMPDRIIVERGGKQNTFWTREDGRLM